VSNGGERKLSAKKEAKGDLSPLPPFRTPISGSTNTGNIGR